MKKLMFAAAAASIGTVAFGGLCDTISPQAEGSCRAYDFKASVKLVDGKRGIDKASNICASDGAVFYRVSASRKVKGVFFDCDVCNLTNTTYGTAAGGRGGEAFLFGGDQSNGGDFAHLYISTSASNYKSVSHTDDAFGDKYGNAYTGSAAYDFKLLNFFGGTTAAKSKKAEALIALDFAELDQYEEIRRWSILCAGFGAQANGVVKSLSGNLAGAVSAATWCGIDTAVFEPCLLDASASAWVFNNNVISAANYQGCTADACVPWSALLVDGVASFANDAVSGTWSLKYNSSESKAAYGSTVLKKVFGADWAYTDSKAAYTAGWAAPLVVKIQ
jgi:hypothetical protein